ncbi:MAG TPA: glycosyltransferase family 2 protein [Bacteroidia bacterium]|nr:glycosyltransferase family 2 protein [Bacteroidia bacterium]
MIKVSVVTVTYNSAETIEDTIKSVINQDYNNIEYIIIDGVSNDNTLQIVDKYKHKITKVISEKDAGIYDAISKGINLATGEVVVALNSDDMYASSDAISSVVEVFKNTHADAVYGDLNYVDRNDTNKIVRKWKSGNYKRGQFLKGWMPPHPTFFVKKHCYQKYGSFDLRLKSAADYELMLRFIHVHEIKVAYLPKLIVNMRAGGQSNVSFKNRFKANREDRKAWEINGLKPGFFTLIRKPLSKIKQYFH